MDYRDRIDSDESKADSGVSNAEVIEWKRMYVSEFSRYYRGILLDIEMIICALRGYTMVVSAENTKWLIKLILVSFDFVKMKIICALKNFMKTVFEINIFRAIIAIQLEVLMRMMDKLYEMN